MLQQSYRLLVRWRTRPPEAIANFLYRIWADLRLSLTGRPSLETIVQEREQRLARNNHSRCRSTDGDE